MLTLAASLIVLAFGPTIYHLALRARFLLSLLDGFMIVAIGGLVLFEILPQSVDLAGWGAVPVALAGLLVPSILEKSRHRLARQAHRVALGLALSGLIAHAIIDGVALVTPDHGGHHFHALPLAVILHRLPVGLAVWLLLRPAYGIGAACSLLGAIGVFTVVGYLVGDAAHPYLTQVGFGYFAALVAGALMHVVVHLPKREVSPRGPGAWRLSSGLGAVIALAILVPLLHEESLPGERGFGELFLHLSLESAPALLIAYLTAGLVHGFLPRATVAWLARGRRVSHSVRGLLFGLPLPICSCGVIPIYRSLVQQGVPLSAALTLLVSAPELGFDAVFLSLELLDGGFTLARVIGAAVIAVLVGIIIGKVGDTMRPPGATTAVSLDGRGSVRERLRAGLRVGLGEIVDHTAPWIVLGLIIAAVADPWIARAGLADLPWLLEVPLFALLGMPVYVCASGATPLVAVLIHNGVSPGAALAFLLTGPATNITTFGVLSDLHGRRLAVAFGATMAGLAILFGYAINGFHPTVQTALSSEAEPGIFFEASLWVLGALFIASLLRQGTRGFTSQILAGQDDPEIGSCHDEGCAEECAPGTVPDLANSGCHAADPAENDVIHADRGLKRN